MTVTITDLFCGAGGSSSGAEQVPGVTVRMAANHWRLAVETHNTNLPHADHDVADISQVDPRRYPRTDILWASPECTNHSQAKGRPRADRHPDLFGETLPDDAAERSRATMWDVLRFAEHHRYRAIVVENVVDVRDWEMWPAWVTGLDNLGYIFEAVYLNSMFARAAGAPAPQSRDRLYVVAWRRGERAPNLPRWTRPPAWCPRCERPVRPVQAWKRVDRQRGRYGQQYVYRCPTTSCRGEQVFPGVLPAAVAIDWSLRGERIGDRDRPLAPKTLARIEAGLRRYARPFHAEFAGHTYERPGSDYIRAWPADTEPFRVMHTIPSKGLVVPAGGTWNDEARPVAEPFRIRTTRDTEALVVPVEGRDGIVARSAGEPARTQTARLQDAVVETPFLAPLRSGRPRTIPVTEPTATVVADGSNHALVVPLRRNGVARPADDAPAPTVAAAGNHHALVMRYQTARGDQGQMSTPVDQPMPTMLAEGARKALIRWDHLLVPYYGSSVARTVAEPVGTVTTVDRNALVGPQIAVEDCTFRMLEPHEIQAAMAFADTYVVLGNKRERVRQLGNAVTPPAARDLIAAVVEALTGEAVAS